MLQMPFPSLTAEEWDELDRIMRTSQGRDFVDYVRRYIRDDLRRMIEADALREFPELDDLERRRIVPTS